MKDMHISSYKTAQKAGNTLVRDIQKCENEGHAYYLSLKTAQRAGTLVRNVQKYYHIKDTQLHHALSLGHSTYYLRK